MTPSWLLLAWRNRKLIGYVVAAVAVLWALWAVVDSYGDRRAKRAADEVRTLWEADTAARDKVAAESIQAARAAEADARKRNEVIENDYQAKLVAAAGERDGYFRMLQQARGSVLTCGAREATGALIAATAGEASIAERIDRAVAGVIVEHRANSDQLDALIAVVKGQQ